MCKEQVYVLMFDSSHHLLKECRLSEGTVDHAVVSPRDIFIDAYGYPSELFKLDMERLGIATKRKPAKVIDIAQYIENNRGTND